MAALAYNVFALGMSAEQKAEISDGMKEFAGSLLFTVPEAATQQNVWSDAYIGNIYPNINKHFGFGLTLGGTAIDMAGFKRASETLVGDFNLLADAFHLCQALMSRTLS